MSSGPAREQPIDPRILDIVKRYWGYDRLRPLQAEAIDAGLNQRDSLVVLPTGGGKSLCYQAPPAILGRTDVVVSPLISLMKDQVDGLKACGYPAAAVHSGMPAEEKSAVERGIASGAYRLVFVAPERLLTPWFMGLVGRANVRAFAIDEAHCVSHWGHDFRPEYRQLRTLKDRFPGASVHAYTATATERVRADIVQQLGLRDPTVLVGVFDRPNLAYRILPRMDSRAQMLEVIRRHAGEAAIVYCISRADTEAMAAFLQGKGVRAAHYHAGMTPQDRHRVQESFSDETLDVVVATVAFGMGIDRSNVRCVVHAAMPKSIEHYQQETGRAGRDGLEAECVLFYSHADVIKWEKLIALSAENAPEGSDVGSIIEAQLGLLEHMRKLCTSTQCRHGSLSAYFGQQLASDGCKACDVCLDELDGVKDGTVIAQKILSCVARVDQRFGVTHVAEVLAGASTDLVRRCGHEQLSTYALLKETPKPSIVNYIHQLVDQGLLTRSAGDRPILSLNDASREVLKGQRQVRLLEAPRAPARTSAAGEEAWAGVDRDLFERLRELRRSIAQERAVPPFVIFADTVLRDLARARPSTLAGMMRIPGIGERKLAQLGEAFLAAILDYCRGNRVSLDAAIFDPPASRATTEVKPNPLKDEAMEMFARGCTIDEVAAKTGRAPSTVGEYLADYVRIRRPAAVDAWVDHATRERVARAAVGCEEDRLKPIFDKLEGSVPYPIIKVVLAHMRIAAETEHAAAAPGGA